MRFLSHSQAARFYDALGANLDTQGFYEVPALRKLAAHLDLASCHAVLEFGCGTGRLAAELLATALPSSATYLGLDISATMVGLARDRLRRFGARAEIRLSDGGSAIDARGGTFDRFICTYVLDLLPDEEIVLVLDEAARVLEPDGLLGLVSLTDGPQPISRLVSTAWRGLYSLSPWLVGGCRPISLGRFLPEARWRILYRKTLVCFGIPSEIVVARPIADPLRSSAPPSSS